MKLIDSHAHIGEEAYDADRAEMLGRAAAAGVEAILVIGYDAASSRRAVDIARRGGAVRLFATAGVAPHHVLETDDTALAQVAATLDEDAVVAVGEIGLDYHYDMPRGAQRDLFARQLGWARQRSLPVVIHSREAEADVAAVLREHGAGAPQDPLRGVIHCFTEGPSMAEAALDFGFYVSFAGIVTFRNAADLRDIAARVPLDRMLIETDSPYLAPVPHRGRRNEPAWVVEVARTIAEVHGAGVDEVAATTAANARALFRLPD